MKSFTPRIKLPKLLLLNFFEKFLTERILSNEQFNLCEVETSLDVIIKFINFQNNKSPGNNGHTVEF